MNHYIVFYLLNILFLFGVFYLPNKFYLPSILCLTNAKISIVAIKTVSSLRSKRINLPGKIYITKDTMQK